MFGDDGDRLTVVLSGGTKIPVILASVSVYGLSSSEYKFLCKPSVFIKHRDGFMISCDDIIRFQTKSVPIDLTGWKGKKIVKVINHGPCEELKEIKE